MCVRLESKGNGLSARINDLEKRLAESDRRVDQAQGENATLRDRMCMSPAKKIGIQNCSCNNVDKVCEIFMILVCISSVN